MHRDVLHGRPGVRKKRMRHKRRDEQQIVRRQRASLAVADPLAGTLDDEDDLVIQDDALRDREPTRHAMGDAYDRVDLFGQQRVGAALAQRAEGGGPLHAFRQRSGRSNRGTHVRSVWEFTRDSSVTADVRNTNMRRATTPPDLPRGANRLRSSLLCLPD